MLKSRHMHGNVLFIILIAIALFGALSYALTNSSRGTANADNERNSINATDYMTFAASVEKTVARMLGDEISENALSFQNDRWVYYNNSIVETAATFPNCSSASCKVFDPAGGGIQAQTFAPVAITSPVATDVASGSAAVYSMKVSGVGSAAWDLVMMIAIVDTKTCLQINNALGIVNPAGAPPSDSWANAPMYNGTFTGPNNATDTIGDVATQIVGKNAGCINRSGGAYGAKDNYFYQVLLAR